MAAYEVSVRCSALDRLLSSVVRTWSERSRYSRSSPKPDETIIRPFFPVLSGKADISLLRGGALADHNERRPIGRMRRLWRARVHHGQHGAAQGFGAVEGLVARGGA